MLNEIVNLYGMVIGVVFTIASLYKLNRKKIKANDKDLYFSMIIYFLLQLIIDSGFLEVIKPFAGFLCLIFICWQILKIDMVHSITSAIFMYIYILIAEICLFLALSTVFQLTTSSSLSNVLALIDNNIYFSFLINFLISIILYLLCNIKRFVNLYTYVSQFICQDKFHKYYPLAMPIFIFILFSFGVICFGNGLVSKIAIFFLLFLLTVYVILNNLKISTEYEKTKEKYASTSKNLIEYEEMMDKYRVNNHENKNQLQMIRNMIRQKERSVDKYIDNLLDTVYMVNEALMMDVAIIPAGGLRATIYSKLVAMDNKSIKHILNLDHKLRQIDFFENYPKITLRVCNLLSIFIDNSIDEVNLLDEKVINIDIFLDNPNTIIFEITNKYISDFDMQRIYEKKYTTKSEGHGYGLALAKEIIDCESRISNNTIIDDDLFTQVLIVDITTKNDNSQHN